MTESTQGGPKDSHQTHRKGGDSCNSGYASWDDDNVQDGGREATFKTLTREEAIVFMAKHPPISVWRVVAVQAATGLVVALIAWLLFGKTPGVVASVLYGTAAVVIPNALLARGITNAISRSSVGAGVVSFMLWEMVKIGFSIAMLVVANRVVHPLSWLALLVAMMVCMKVNWLALMWQRRSSAVMSNSALK